MADHATTTNLDVIENGKATTESVVPPQTSINLATGDGKRGAKQKGNGKGENGDENKKDFEDEKPKSVGVLKLFFKYATMLELLYMFLGTCFAGLTGWVYTRTELGFVP